MSQHPTGMTQMTAVGAELLAEPTLSRRLSVGCVLAGVLKFPMNTWSPQAAMGRIVIRILLVAQQQ